MGRRKEALNSETMIDRAKIAQHDHDRQLRAQGYDPQYIGITEVAPVRCCGCGRQIPWSVLKGYAS